MPAVPIKAPGHAGPILCDAFGCGRVAIASSVESDIEPPIQEPHNVEWKPDPSHPDGGTHEITSRGVTRPSLNRKVTPKINYCGKHTNLPFSPDAELATANMVPGGDGKGGIAVLHHTNPHAKRTA